MNKPKRLKPFYAWAIKAKDEDSSPLVMSGGIYVIYDTKKDAVKSLYCFDDEIIRVKITPV